MDSSAAIRPTNAHETQEDDEGIGPAFLKGMAIGVAIAAALLLARDAADPRAGARAWTLAAPAALAARADRESSQSPGEPDPAAQASAAGDPAEPASADGPELTPDGRALAAWVAASGDNAGAPYAIVDKRLARVMVFSGRGSALASAPVLLGKARGDESAPGIGDKPLAAIADAEKTTPAGRFVSEPGINAGGEDVIWVDYDAAVSMHRVRATNPAERRLERLASPAPEEHRISFGCINVPAAFFDRHLKPSLGRSKALVYVLPETRSLAEQFPELAKRQRA